MFKLKYKKLLISIISLFFIIGLLLNIPIKNTQAITQNLNYSFENDYIFNSDNLTYEIFNIRNQTTITQDNYTSTYDFLETPVGTSGTDIDFIDTADIPIDTSLEIIESEFGHNRVLEFYDDNDGDNAEFTHNLDDIVSGTVEFWWKQDTDTADTHIRWYFGGFGASQTISLQFDVSEGIIGWWNGGFNELTDIINDFWYHIRIDFECGSGNYEGLAPDKWHIYINGVKYSDLPFDVSVNSFDTFWIAVGGTANDYVYFDAFGETWDDYSIGQNIAYPETSTTEIQEIDKCDFAYNITSYEPITLASNTIDNNWVENDDVSDVHVQTFGVSHGVSIDYGNSQDQDTYGISKEFGYNTENIFNISFNILSMDLYNPHLDGWYFNIYTYDDTLLVSLLFELTTPPTTSLYYYDGSSYIPIHDIVSLFGFNFNIYINDRVILRLDDDDVIYNWYFSELTDKIGINTIEVIGGDAVDIGDFAHVDIHSIGLYINGSSFLVDDLSSIIIETDIENWNDSTHNLFGITANGSFSFSVFYGTIFQDVILSYSTFISETKLVNYLGAQIFEGSQAYTFVCSSNVSFTVSEVYVYAINLKEGLNIYLPTISYNNVDESENYFYVENHKLRFRVDLNSESYEGISAIFTIPEISTLNGTISFNNLYVGHLPPYLCLNYTYANTDYYQFKNYPNTIKHILPQNKYLYQFIINVSDYIPFSDDNYTNHESGFIEGYIQNIKLGYIPDISITITTLDLITVIIPIMFIFIPSLMFYYGFGKEAVIPAIILMSIIALISNLIQAWIFFIIAYSVFIQLITQRKRLK